MKKIIAVLLGTLIVLSLCACGGLAPKEVAADFLEAVKAGDMDAANELYGGNASKLLKKAETDSLTDVKFTKTLRKKLLSFEYTLDEETVNDDKATVNVTIKTYDFGKAFTEFFNEYMKQGFALTYEGASEKEMKTTANEIFSEKLQAAELDYEGKAVINLTKKEGGWIVDDLKKNQDFLNALSGGMLKTSENMSNAFNSDTEEE